MRNRRCGNRCKESGARCIKERGHLHACIYSAEDRALRDHVKALYEAQRPDVLFARQLEKEARGDA